MAHSSHILPRRSPGYVAELERVRRAAGLSQTVVTDRMGVTRATWSRIINERSRVGKAPRPSFDTVAAMAEAVNLTFALVPMGEPAPESAPPAAQAAPPILGRDYRPRAEHEPMPEPSSRSRSLMGWLRSVRRERGIKLDDMAERIGVGEHRLSAIEHGKREPYLADAVRYGEECGVTLAFLEPAAVPFASLSRESADAVRQLVTAYVDHRIRNGQVVPPGLLDAAEALERAAEPDTMDNAA